MYVLDNLARRVAEVRFPEILPRNAFRRNNIPEGMGGIWMEVGTMSKYVRSFSGHPEVIDFARTLVLGCDPRDLVCEVVTVHDLVRSRVRFVQDPTAREAVSSPLKFLDDIEYKGRSTGDCDELSTFEATLLAAIGIEPRFRFGGQGAEMFHVWVQAQIGNEWVNLEPSGYLEAGYYYEFPSYVEKQIFE